MSAEMPVWVNLIEQKIGSTEKTITDAIARLTLRLDAVVSVQTDQGKDIVRLQTELVNMRDNLRHEIDEVKDGIPDCQTCSTPKSRRKREVAVAAGAGGTALFVWEMLQWIGQRLSPGS